MRKRLRLKFEVKLTIILIIGFITIISLALLVDKLDKKFMKSCLEQGYSEQHCISHK